MTDDSDAARPDAEVDAATVPSRPRGGHVDWLPWSVDAFEAAAVAERPILLSLTATWSEECQQMDAETYGEPRIAAAVDDGFVPIRADVDRQPRVASRYAMGGVPSTVFLAPNGEVLTGAGALSPDGMRGAIEGVRRTWQEQGADAGRVPRELVDQEPPAGELEAAIETHLVAALRENYDERAGGWGTGAKFPLPRTVEFALKRERQMATRTLSAIEANLLDEVGGGFHRSAASADWSGLQTEKLLDANAALVRAFASAYRYTGEESYRDAARRGVEYLTTTLWTDVGESGAFAASQSGDEGADYYGLEETERASADASPVDATVLADWNAMAVDGLLTYAAVTDDEQARGFARRALDTLTTDLLEDGRIVHYLAPQRGANGTGASDGAAGPNHDAARPSGGGAVSIDDAARSSDDGAVSIDGAADPSERGLLLDHARTIRALVTARSVLGPDPGIGHDPVALATSLADHALEQLRPDASFVDGPRSGPGLLDRPLRPLDGNVELAGALLDLHQLTGEDRYREAARSATEAFAGAHERFGPQAAHFGSVAARLLHGTMRIDVATPAGSDLHRAALRVADHEAIVVPAAVDRDERYEAGAAYVVTDERVSEAAKTPEAVDECVRSVA